MREPGFSELLDRYSKRGDADTEPGEI